MGGWRGPWEASSPRPGTTPNEFLYRGEQFDPDLGLYYLRARYYNPLTGRFMSRDVNEGNIRIPATLHKYLYTGGDPVNRIDPLGRDAEGDYAELNLNNLTHDVSYAAQQLRFLREEWRSTQSPRRS
jgi:RHS repeat-associated protein